MNNTAQATQTIGPPATAQPLQNPILERLKNTRNLYTDYTLLCDGHEFKVHRLILHLHSTTLAAAFSGPWIEGRSGASLEIKDHEAEVVQAMLDFFYTSAYGALEGSSKLMFHLKVYALAGYYNAGGLIYASEQRLKKACYREWEIEDLIHAVRYLENEERKGMKGHAELEEDLAQDRGGQYCEALGERGVLADAE